MDAWGLAWGLWKRRGRPSQTIGGSVARQTDGFLRSLPICEQVILYRAGLVTSAAAFVTAASSAFMPDDFPLKSFLQGAYDPLYIVGAGGLGVSLILIHIYVTPIKRALQLLWAVGVLGSVALAINFAAPADRGLVEFVLENPAGIWAVGPLFAALTGLAFKEGKIIKLAF